MKWIFISIAIIFIIVLTFALCKVSSIESRRRETEEAQFYEDHPTVNKN